MDWIIQLRSKIGDMEYNIVNKTASFVTIRCNRKCYRCGKRGIIYQLPSDVSTCDNCGYSNGINPMEFAAD